MRRSGTGPWLITGAAGFIGFHLARSLLADGIEVVGIDDLNPYYDPRLKRMRLAALDSDGFTFLRRDIARDGIVADAIRTHRPRRVVHLAAQAGVRQALIDPLPYARSNLLGFVQVAEACVHQGVEHLVYASSSSVYGETARTPFSEHDPAGHPVSLYAATKRANELLAHSYSHVHGLPTTGLRFFTVYGPWGRPDMAYYRFARAITTGTPIQVFGDGTARRDFTYIDDIVEGIRRTAELVPTADPAWSTERSDPASSTSPYRLYNIGGGQQHTVDELIRLLEAALGRRAVRCHVPPQPGDVGQTHASVDDLVDATGYRPTTTLAEGIRRFAAWFLAHDGLAASSMLEEAVGAGGPSALHSAS
jgi:UDP-glucuronate 4-epimerase